MVVLVMALLSSADSLLMTLPRDRCALQLYDVRHWGVVVRWKNIDAKTDTELVDGKVQSLQPVA
jgi:hypothetical protein